MPPGDSRALGHGSSPAPADTSLYAPEAYLEQFEQIRTQLGIERWFVCGYSLGAGLTIRYAHDFAQHVYAHIFTNSNSALADTAQIQEWRIRQPSRLVIFAEVGWRL